MPDILNKYAPKFTTGNLLRDTRLLDKNTPTRYIDSVDMRSEVYILINYKCPVFLAIGPAKSCSRVRVTFDYIDAYYKQVILEEEQTCLF